MRFRHPICNIRNEQNTPCSARRAVLCTHGVRRPRTGSRQTHRCQRLRPCGRSPHAGTRRLRHRRGGRHDFRHHDRCHGTLLSEEPAARRHRDRGADARLRSRASAGPYPCGRVARGQFRDRRKRHRHGSGRGVGQPQRHAPPRGPGPGQRARRRAVREDQCRLPGGGPEFPARRARGGRLPELRLRPGAHQRPRRPLLADSDRLASHLLVARGRLRPGADPGQHDRTRGGAARRRLGALRRLGHRRHDQRHHARSGAQHGAGRAHDHLRRLRQRLRQQHLVQRLARVGQQQGGALRLRPEPPPLGLRSRRRRLHRIARAHAADRGCPSFPAHGRHVAALGPVPPHRRVPPRRRPPRAAAPRGPRGGADRPFDRRGQPDVRFLDPRPQRPPRRLRVVPEHGPQELLRHGRGSRRLRPYARHHGGVGRAVYPHVRPPVVHALRADARRRVQLRRPGG